MFILLIVQLEWVQTWLAVAELVLLLQAELLSGGVAG